ncbi:Thiol peroxidase, Bcp-type [Chondromyces apiculatus DSM 436]|uniref:thioredoxin-dependent peroxiredoxin n=1 Tax=Chondromyces apiculatus DSM 436 TaxID=1192034 RepID=A0A017T2H5_9BACT|nr:Thiol peroxidase, Bcp-type [Chondromyces apiculatus DSM 436]
MPVGSPAPDLFAPDQNGALQRLSDQRGRAVVVYFYPKDGTPGCTEEACAFRDVWDKYKTSNVVVFGVSTDSRESHEAFARENKLPFSILSDPDQTWIAAFGVPMSLGVAKRVTFLIDPDGKVAKVYPDVDPGVHATQVLKDAAALTGAAPPDSAAPTPGGAAPAAPTDPAAPPANGAPAAPPAGATPPAPAPAAPPK